MDKKIILMQLMNRRNIIANRGKDSAGVLRKLDRQIRNLKKEIE